MSRYVEISGHQIDAIKNRIESLVEFCDREEKAYKERYTNWEWRQKANDEHRKKRAEQQKRIEAGEEIPKDEKVGYYEPYANNYRPSPPNLSSEDAMIGRLEKIVNDFEKAR